MVAQAQFLRHPLSAVAPEPQPPDIGTNDPGQRELTTTA
jgi:hypothetical protein